MPSLMDMLSNDLVSRMAATSTRQIKVKLRVPQMTKAHTSLATKQMAREFVSSVYLISLQLE